VLETIAGGEGLPEWAASVFFCLVLCGKTSMKHEKQKPEDTAFTLREKTIVFIR